MSLNSEEESTSKLFNPSDKIPDFEIDDETRKALCFREDLIVTSKDESTSPPKPVGGYCISMESIGREGNEFMVQVLSSLSVKDSFAGSKVLSSTTSRLHCLEEKRTEYIHRDDGLHEKVLFIGLEDDLYHLESEDLCPCDKSSWQKDLSLCFSGNMISEGANVLLMRYLALKNFHGDLSFQSVMIDGELTTCDYKCKEARSTKVNGRIVEVYTIERKMQEECGLIHNTKTYMTRNGNILRHDWLEVPYLLQINSLVDPNEIDNKRVRNVDPWTSRWSDDVQMMSMYLDRKTCKMAQQAEYLADHPEVKQLISDYTQTLLAVKPINVLSFTIQHFASFAKNPDPSENISSNESNVDMSQQSKQKPKRICSVCGTGFDCLMTKEQPNVESEGHRATPGSHCPGSRVLSACSVFSKCPSDASCVRKIAASNDVISTCSQACIACKNHGQQLSRCSLYPECKETCEGCQPFGEPCDFSPECEKTCQGCLSLSKSCSFAPGCENTCKGCLSLRRTCSSAPECENTCKGCLSLRRTCSAAPECESTCKGCLSLRKSCSFAPGCDKTCDGCQSLRKTCSFSSGCDKTCDGCLSLGKSCSFAPDCEKTCNGCEALEERCSLHPECENTCKGCQPVLEPCTLQKDCPECLGCRKVCSEIEVCPNCEKCNVEALHTARVVGDCTKCGTESIDNRVNLVIKK